MASPSDTTYKVKWIKWTAKDGAAGTSMIPIVTQNVNGPCPLLALVNILFLRGQAHLDTEVKTVSSQLLLQILHDCIVRLAPQDLSQQADYQFNVDDAIASLPKLCTGIDVNLRFTGVNQFEFTPDCIIFDLLTVPLYHGWLVEPEHGPVADAVGQYSYNQLIDSIIEAKRSGEQDKVVRASLAEDFLESTATQLIYRGLCELNSMLKDGEPCVFFRNNHFSTLLKNDGELFCLMTDQGFLNDSRIVWQSLTVDGDGRFVDAGFQTVPQSNASPQEQLDNDLMIALAMSLGDNEGPDIAAGGASRDGSDQSALKLQKEDNKLAAQVQQRQTSPIDMIDELRNKDACQAAIADPTPLIGPQTDDNHDGGVELSSAPSQTPVTANNQGSKPTKNETTSADRDDQPAQQQHPSVPATP